MPPQTVSVRHNDLRNKRATRRKGPLRLRRAPVHPMLPPAPAPATVAEELLTTFNEMRAELLSTLWFVLGNAEDAEDVTQEAFLRCWRAREGLPEVHNLRAWIFRVGFNAAKDLQRSPWRRRARPLCPEEMQREDTCAPIHEAEDREALQQLRDALTNLRPDEKEVFLLRQNGELTYEQIGELYDRPVGTVKTQMRSALQKLRKVLA